VNIKQPANPPYFEGLFQRLAAADPATVAAFGRHVHWGYWQDPDQATGSSVEYGEAAELLCQELCDVAAIRDGDRVLDVGCGFGGTLASLNERRSRLDMMGINIDARQLARAEATIRPLHENTLTFLAADAAQLPLPDDSFDVVLAVECIFHFDRAAFFAEAARVLRCGGSLTLSDFVPSERALEYLDAIDFSNDEAIRWSYGTIDLTCSTVRYHELAAENGLQFTDAIDITKHTLPTYKFLYQNADRWPDRDEAALFTRATRMLDKACRNGILAYKILKFQCP